MARYAPATGDIDPQQLLHALEEEGLRVIEWTDEPNATYPAHTHPHREVRVILDGWMTIRVGGASFELGPGDRIDLDPGEEHAASVHAVGVRYLAGSDQ